MLPSPTPVLAAAGSSEGRAIVSGNVRDASGGPIVGANVALRAFGSSAPLARVLSGPDGRFALPAPLGYFEVSADADAYSHAALGIHSPAESVTLVLAAGAAIEGQVIERATGRPAAAISVRAESRNGLWQPTVSGVSGADGHFRIPALAAGGYAVQVLDAAFRSEPYWVVVGVGQSSDPIEILVDGASRLTAKLFAGGAPCPAGLLQVSGPVESAVSSDGTGTALIDGLLPGSYSLRASCDGAITVSETLELGSQPVLRTFDLSRGLELLGKVISAAGRPLTGIDVSVRRVLEASSAGRSAAAPAQSGPCVTDANGTFACGGFTPGAYDCEVLAHGHIIGDPTRITLTSEPSAPVVLRARDLASIRVSISPSPGELGRRVLYARRGDELPAPARRDGDAFLFENLELGSYAVYAGIGPDEPPRARHVELTREDEVASVSLELETALAISGRVLDSAKQPVPDVWVHAAPVEALFADRRDDAVLTDETGAFEIAGLSPGGYDVQASSSSGDAVARAVPAGARDVMVTVAANGSIAGVVTTAAGQPAAGCTLELRQPGGRHEQIAVSSSGRWTIPWLVPGAYTFAASSPEGTATRDVNLAPGAQLALSLVLDRESEPALAATTAAPSATR